MDDVYLLKTDVNGEFLWDKTYGGNNNDGGVSICQTKDGGYLIVGYTSSYGNGSSDVYLIKTDSNGIVQWSRTYGGPKDDYGSYVIQSKDGGYVITGYTTSFEDSSGDVYLIKTHPDGTLLWSKTYGGEDMDYGYTVIEDDKGYAIEGYAASYGSGNFDYYVIKTNYDGDMLWNVTYGGAYSDICKSILLTDDDKYVVSGYTTSYGNGSNDIYLVGIDNNGSMLWNMTYGGPDSEILSRIIPDQRGLLNIGSRINESEYILYI